MRAPRASSSLARTRPPRRRTGVRIAVLAAALLATAVVLGLSFAGSPARIPEGVQIAAVEVGGLSAGEARALLERRADRFARVPVTFVAGSTRWRIRPATLGVEVDWVAAVEAARRQGEGFGPVGGLRRLRTRFFGADISPPTRVYEAALDYELGRMARALGRGPRDAALVLRGLRPRVVPGRTGRVLDRAAAASIVVRALASFSRAPVALPVRVVRPDVTTVELRPAVAQTRTALSKPVRLAIGTTRWRLTRWRVAELLELPRGGETELAVGGPAAERWLDRLSKLVDRKPEDAGFEAVGDGNVRVVPAVAGTELDREATAESVLRAAVSPTARLATAVVRTAEPELTTAEAEAMGITRVLSTYKTLYAGTADRIHNLQLAISLLDGAIVPPGKTFSLNGRVGERTPERGFRVAPVIINGEYEEAVGGGVSQVATTIFNAAWEAGVKIVERNPHALYISRYPDGRDATVNYPDLDLKFRNDTESPILLRASSDSTGITVELWGAPTGRRVESQTGPLVVTGPPKVKRIKDPTLRKGKTEVEEEGEPSRTIVVTRTVYEADGSVLYDESWRTSYRAEKRIVRVGTKKPEKEKPETPEEPEEPAVTTTETEPQTEPEPRP